MKEAVHLQTAASKRQQLTAFTFNKKKGQFGFVSWSSVTTRCLECCVIVSVQPAGFTTAPDVLRRFSIFNLSPKPKMWFPIVHSPLNIMT